MVIGVGGLHRDGFGDDLYDFELQRWSEGYEVSQIVIEGTMYSRAGAAGLTAVRVSSQSRSSKSWSAK